jgi:hypothetical protein
MVEKNSGVPPLNEVAAPVLQSELTESVQDAGTTTPHAKRTRKSKIKPDVENDTVAGKDPVNTEQSNIPAITAPGSEQPATAPSTAAVAEENKDPVVAETVENKVAVTDQKRKHKRPRPIPQIEHKRVVHYYRQVKPVKKKDRRSGDKDRRDGDGPRNRDDERAKKSKYDDRDYSDEDDEEELLSDSDWSIDSGDDSETSDGDSDDDEPVKKHEPGQDKRRDDGGRFAPVHAVMQYKIV